MIEFKIVSLASLVIIFVSVFFIHFAFNNYFRVSEMCIKTSGPYCLPENTNMYMIFSFMVIVVFLIVIETTIYLMFKEVEMQLKAGTESQKRLKDTIESLEKREKKIQRAKKDAHKKYFTRKISEKTFEHLKQKYDTEIAGIEMELEEMKKKIFTGWLK